MVVKVELAEVVVTIVVDGTAEVDGVCVAVGLLPVGDDGKWEGGDGWEDASLVLLLLLLLLAEEVEGGSWSQPLAVPERIVVEGVTSLVIVTVNIPDPIAVVVSVRTTVTVVTPGSVLLIPSEHPCGR
jgi:hypothetical protein